MKRILDFLKDEPGIAAIIVLAIFFFFLIGSMLSSTIQDTKRNQEESLLSRRKEYLQALTDTALRVCSPTGESISQDCLSQTAQTLNSLAKQVK
jgi:hypothetical protein